MSKNQLVNAYRGIKSGQPYILKVKTDERGHIPYEIVDIVPARNESHDAIIYAAGCLKDDPRVTKFMISVPVNDQNNEIWTDARPLGADFAIIHENEVRVTLQGSEYSGKGGL